MNEQSESCDVDKLVDDFLSELNALSNSLESARAEPELGSVEAVERRELVRPSFSPPEARPAPDTPLPPEPPPEKRPRANSGRCRNIDILLMDEVYPTPLRRKPDEFEFPYNYRKLYRSRFWLFRHPRFTAWSTAALGLICVVAFIYFRDPFGLIREQKQRATASPGHLAETQAVAIDKIIPQYPSRAKKLGIKGVVEVQAVVDGDGRVVRATPLSGPAQLRSAAVDAVEQCRFKPATRGGVTFESTVTVPVRFDR